MKQEKTCENCGFRNINYKCTVVLPFWLGYEMIQGKYRTTVDKSLIKIDEPACSFWKERDELF